MKIALTVNVFVSEQSQEVTVMIPYCPVCFENMIIRHANVAPPPDMGGLAGPEQMYMDIGSISFVCPEHPSEVEFLTFEQIEQINKFPVGRQMFKQTMRYNRKQRRDRKH